MIVVWMSRWACACLSSALYRDAPLQDSIALIMSLSLSSLRLILENIRLEKEELEILKD
jgi:hypothetical protein